MSTVMYDLWDFSSVSQTAVMGLVMFAVTGAGVALALLLGGRGAVQNIGS
jgi:iron(III) transport system permease protein